MAEISFTVLFALFKLSIKAFVVDFLEDQFDSDSFNHKEKEMAEHVMSLDQENKVVTKNGDEETDHHHEENTDLETNTSLLSGLNLVLVVSFLSLSSSNDSHDFNETMKEMQTGNYEHKAKHGSCSQTRRREINMYPALGRQSSKVHTKIRDSRHCRRL